jgi:ABC-type multidrug transport system fused ATPase/permease subunit
MVTTFLRRRFEGFSYFYSQLGFRLLLMLGLSILVGLLDGFGLSMFLPLLQLASGDQLVGSVSTGFSVVNDFIGMLDVQLTIPVVLMIMVVFFALKGIVSFFQYYFRVYLQELFIYRVRKQNIDGLNKLAYKAFLESDAGRIQNTLVGEVDRVSKAFQSYFLGVQALIMVLVYISLAFLANPQFALLVSVGGALTNLIYQGIYRKTKGVSRKLTTDTNELQGLIFQHIFNYKYLKATGNLNKYGKKLELYVRNIQLKNKRIGYLMATLNASREPLVILVVALVIYIQTDMLHSTIGPIVISLLFFYRALSFLMQMQSHQNFYLSVHGSLSNMETFTQELERGADSFGTIVFPGLRASLQIENGHLAFHDRRVLNGITLRIEKNETVAFVGASGGGKTTLINVLTGLIPLDGGVYLIDGRPSTELDVATFQRRIGYITQDAVIFNDTVFNNVTLWDEPTEENKKRFWETLRKSSSLQFVESLPLGDETVLGINGMSLSGGQKQRISIARELYKEIDILILDEATSALDSVTESEIQQSLEALRGHYTILMVAHRLSTVKFADRIVLMKEGQIVQVGSFAQLTATSEEFNTMVRLQELN